MDPPHSLHRASPAEVRQRIVAEARERPFLLYRDDSGEQQIIDLNDVPARFNIGRSASNDLALTWDDQVSRVHASLERLGTVWTFVDDGRSHNGSFIEGSPVHGRQRLSDGDTITIGQTILLFRDPGSPDSRRTATADRRPMPTVTAAQQRVLVELCRPYANASFAVPASNRQIADALIIGVETVKTHMRALFEAFSLGDLPQHQKRAALAQAALAAGAVTEPNQQG
jgi:pSer/pThr/pTyr-binding forkhead associated (FHA) protein